MTTDQYSLIVFDWDGTLMDSTPAIIAAIQGACRDLGLPVPPDEAAGWVIGLGIEEAIRAVVPELDPSQYPGFSARYRFHFLTRDPELRLFPGVEDMLHRLSLAGAQLAVATGKSRQGLDRSLQSTGLTSAFSATRCADETLSKPNPAMLHELMDELLAEPHDTVMIGDTSHDLNMARNARVHGVGVSYGAHSLADLRGADPRIIVHSVPELTQWLHERSPVRP